MRPGEPDRRQPVPVLALQPVREEQQFLGRDLDLDLVPVGVLALLGDTYQVVLGPEVVAGDGARQPVGEAPGNQPAVVLFQDDLEHPGAVERTQRGPADHVGPGRGRRFEQGILDKLAQFVRLGLDRPLGVGDGQRDPELDGLHRPAGAAHLVDLLEPFLAVELVVPRVDGQAGVLERIAGDADLTEQLLLRRLGKRL